MGQPLRWFEPNIVYECTIRVVEGRALLTPTPESDELILGVIGRAQHVYAEVNLHGIVVLSNHITCQLSSKEGKDIAAFMQHVNGNVSRELGILYEWTGPKWERAYRPIPIFGEEAMEERFTYLAAQGVKEGL